MIDREKVISDLAEVYTLMRSFATDAGRGSAICEAYRKYADIVADAIVLLKSDHETSRHSGYSNPGITGG